MRLRLILAVIDMEYSNLFLADHVVEIVHDIVKMMDDVVTAVARVAGVKAHPELIIMGYAVIDARQLLKRTADLGTFSGHGLKSDITVCA